MTYAERGKFLVPVPRGYRITIATRFVYPNLMTDLICHFGRQHELRQRGSSNHRHRRLLRARRERPCCCRAAEQRDELAPLHLRGHSTTSSARAISADGSSIPSALAVLRLITSSNFVGSCTGRSADFSPLKPAACRHGDSEE